MKKFLLLPLVALMFVGCSKDAMTADPDMAAPKTAQQDGPYPIKVVFSDNGQYSPGPNLTLSYTGEDWETHEIQIKSLGTYEFVARGMSVFLQGEVTYLGSAPYVDFICHPDEESRGYTQRFTMPESIAMNNGIPIGEPIFGQYYTVVLSYEGVN